MMQKLESLLELLERARHQLHGRRFRADEEDLLRNIKFIVEQCEECIQELQDEAEKFKKNLIESLSELQPAESHILSERAR